MAFVWSLLGLSIAFIAYPSSSLALSTSKLKLPISAISAAPALLPNIPPPTLSPDISPLLPASPATSPTPTADTSLPTIPSSPSPPNPDAMVRPRPDTAFPPSGSLPVSSSSSLVLKLSDAYLNSIVVLGLIAFWLMQLFGM